MAARRRVFARRSVLGILAAMSQPTNLASMMRGLLRWSADRGIERGELLREAGIDVDVLDGRFARVPREAHVAVWNGLERLLGDPDFGLVHAETLLTPSSLGVVGLLSMTRATVADSAFAAVKYARVLKQDIRSRAYFTDKSLVIELETQEGSPRAVADCSLLAYLIFLQRWTGESFGAREVGFQHSSARSRAAYERWFPCPIRFGQACNSIAFDRRVADLPLTTAQPDLAAYLEELADSLLSDVADGEGDGEGTTDGIRRAVREAVGAGDARLTTVAAGLGLSARSLQRLLAASHLEYRALVDDARRAAALPLVARTDLPFDAIAERVGFSEARSFRRAFRRWAGVSPSELRRTRADRAGAARRGEN